MDKNLDYEPVDRNSETLEDILSELPYSYEVVGSGGLASLYLINGKKKVLAGTLPAEYLLKLADAIIQSYRGNSIFFHSIEVYQSWRDLFNLL